MGVFGIDRIKRYSFNALEEKTRYHWGYQINQGKDIVWHDFYQIEFKEKNLLNQSIIENYDLIDDKMLKILNTLGNRAKLKAGVKVHTPLTTLQLNSSKKDKFEHETFKWFGENDRSKAISQVLKPIEVNKELPTLNSDIQQKE